MNKNSFLYFDISFLINELFPFFSSLLILLLIVMSVNEYIKKLQLISYYTSIISTIININSFLISDFLFEEEFYFDYLFSINPDYEIIQFIIGILSAILFETIYCLKDKNITDEIELFFLLISSAIFQIIFYINDLFLLFLCLEIIALSSYVLIVSKKFSILTIEAGFKYYIYNAFSSGIFFFGIILIYFSIIIFKIISI